ncbi:MAG: hypothetical protein ACI8ZO_001357 [Flavobacteriales bacterium]
MLKLKFFIFSLLLIGSFNLSGQDIDQDLVQLSGAVLLADSTNPKPIPFAHILNVNRSEGTITNGEGFFSLVVAEGDTILFSAIGLKNNTFIVPSPLEESDYTLIQFMEQDTVMLETINLSPWPSKEEFNQAFLDLELPTDDLLRARKNITQSAIRQLSSNIPMDANMNYKNTINQYNSYLYNQGMYYGNNGGQAVLNALTNPFAWSSFIKSLKNR